MSWKSKRPGWVRIFFSKPGLFLNHCTFERRLFCRKRLVKSGCIFLFEGPLLTDPVRFGGCSALRKVHTETIKSRPRRSRVLRPKINLKKSGWFYPANSVNRLRHLFFQRIYIINIPTRTCVNDTYFSPECDLCTLLR